jgi:DNA-binding MarR family transcriptional regulator
MKQIKEQEAIFSTIFRTKPGLVMMELWKNEGRSYSSKLAKQADCTYSHIVKIINRLEKAKIITSIKDGRIRKIELTEKGFKIANLIAQIDSLLKDENHENRL